MYEKAPLREEANGERKEQSGARETRMETKAMGDERKARTMSRLYRAITGLKDMETLRANLKGDKGRH